MSLFGTPADRLRSKAQRAIRGSDRAIAGNDAATALDHIRTAEGAIREALALDPRPDDRAVLGSLLYNRSTILMITGDPAGALEAANSALDFLHAVDPTFFKPDAVRTVLANNQRGPSVEEAIAHAADARIRCARLAAMLGDRARRWIELHGEPAVQTYQELVRHGHRYTEADLRRVTDELAAAWREVRD